MSKTLKTFSQHVTEGLRRVTGKNLTRNEARGLAIRLLVEEGGGFPPPALYVPLMEELHRETNQAVPS